MNYVLAALFAVMVGCGPLGILIYHELECRKSEASRG